MSATRENATDAVKTVINKYYGGQESLFNRVLTQSVQEQDDCWMVTVFLSDIFGDVNSKTYQVNKKKNATIRIIQISQERRTRYSYDKP